MHAAGRSLEGGGRGPKPQGERCRDWVQSTREYHFRQKDRQEEIKHAPLSQVPHCDNVSISRKISGGCAVVLRGVLLEEDSFLERDHRSSGRFICANRQSKRQPLAKDERFSSLVALSELVGGCSIFHASFSAPFSSLLSTVSWHLICCAFVRSLQNLATPSGRSPRPACGGTRRWSSSSSLPTPWTKGTGSSSASGSSVRSSRVRSVFFRSSSCGWVRHSLHTHTLGLG